MKKTWLVCSCSWIALICAIVVCVLPGAVVAQDTAAAPAVTSSTDVPLVEYLPKEVSKAPSTNAWAALLGKYAKRVSIGASDAIRQTPGSSSVTDLQHAAAISALYEFWQPQWSPANNWVVECGVGPIVTYVPEWSETNVGAGLSASVFKLTRLQSIIDGTMVEQVAPRLIIKLVIGLQLQTDMLFNGDGFHGRGVLALTLPMS